MLIKNKHIISIFEPKYSDLLKPIFEKVYAYKKHVSQKLRGGHIENRYGNLSEGYG